MRDSVHYLDRANVIVLKTNRTYFVTPSVNSTCFLQFGQNMLSKSELLSLSDSNLLPISVQKQINQGESGTIQGCNVTQCPPLEPQVQPGGAGDVRLAVSPDWVQRGVSAQHHPGAGPHGGRPRRL